MLGSQGLQVQQPGLEAVVYPEALEHILLILFWFL